MKKRAITLVEITLACVILIIAIVPLIRNSHSTAEKAIETEKIQMAERILESIKSEMMTMQFKTFYDRAESESLDPNIAGPFELSDRGAGHPAVYNLEDSRSEIIEHNILHQAYDQAGLEWKTK